MPFFIIWVLMIIGTFLGAVVTQTLGGMAIGALAGLCIGSLITGEHL